MALIVYATRLKAVHLKESNKSMAAAKYMIVQHLESNNLRMLVICLKEHFKQKRVKKISICSRQKL